MLFRILAVDALSGAPVEGADVAVSLTLAGPCGPRLAWKSWAPLVTGEGRWELSMPAPSGPDTVVAFRANASGYGGVERVLAREDVPAPEVDVELRLRPLGELVVPDGPLAGLHDLSGAEPPRVLAPGAHALPAGRYAWGRGGEHGEATVPAGGSAALPGPGPLPGENLTGVVLVEGEPRAGALVFLGPPGDATVALPGLTAAAVTDPEGAFRLPWPRGNATVVAWVPGQGRGAGSLAWEPVDEAAEGVTLRARAPAC